MLAIAVNLNPLDIRVKQGKDLVLLIRIMEKVVRIKKSL